METANITGMDTLEDGEISDSDYTPLERPASLIPASSSFVKTSLNRSAPLPVSSDEKDSSESDDSCDSDGPKRPKVARPRLLQKAKPAVPDKYNVWTKDLQEAALNEQLLNCEVGLATYDKSRDVESYDYNIAYSLSRPSKFESERTASPTESSEPEPRSRSTKRRHDDRGNVRDRLGPRSSSQVTDVRDRLGPRPGLANQDREEDSPPPRLLSDLKVTEQSAPEDVAMDIANKLFETKEMLVQKVVEVLGVTRAIQLFNKTKDIEADGGMMIFNGARRRTPGGIFFYMLRNEPDITRAQHDEIFADEQRELVRHRRSSKANKRKSEVNRLRLEQELKLPALLTRGELVVQQMAAGVATTTKNDEEEEGEEGELEVSNPPPSPATDPRELSLEGGAIDLQGCGVEIEGARKITAYDDDDFLDIGAGDDMEVF